MSKYKLHSVKYNLLMNIILKLSSVIFPLITFPYTTRILGVENYGRASFAASVVSYFSLIASLGIPSYAVRKCAQKRDAPDELSKTVKEILFINSISLIITYICFIIIVIITPRFKVDSTILFINSASIILQTFGVEWFYQAIEQYDYITARNIVFKIISVALLFICVKQTDDIIPYSIVAVVGTVGSNFLNLIRLPKFVNLRVKYVLDIKQHLKPIFTLFFYYAATTIYTNLDVVMLGFLTTNVAVGYYNAAVKLKGVLVSVVTALGAVALPRASYYLSNKEDRKFVSLIKTSLNYVLMLSLSISIYCIIEARPILLFLAGSEYAGAIDAMTWIMPSIIFIGIGSITAWQLLIPLGRDRCTLIGAITGAIVNFLVNWFLIPNCGAVGASIGTLCAEMGVVFVHIIGLRDILRQYIDYNDIKKIVVGVVIASTVLLLMNSIIKYDSNFIECILTGIIFFAIYGIIESIFKEETITKFWNITLSALNKRKFS